jgi:hypothetical protein
MGKKNDTSTPSAAMPEGRAPIETVPPVAEAKVAAKPVAKKKPAKKKAPARKKPAAPTTEEIALRAYFISEDRHRHGLHGDAHSDWVEAERQLLAGEKGKSKKKSR